MNKTEKYLKEKIQEMPQPKRELSFITDAAKLQEGGSKSVNGNRVRRRSVGYAALAVSALLVIVSVPVAAHIPYLAERMQSLSDKEIQELSDMTQQQMTEVDLFSRPLSEEERIRMEALRQEYKDGIFPNGEISVVSENEQTDIDYYYDKNVGMFHLPDSRELTDEELRQYIDFLYKRDYSLRAHTAQEQADNPALVAKTVYELPDEFEMPEKHGEIILDWLRLYDIRDMELSDLENTVEIDGIYRPSEDIGNYVYRYPMAEGTLRFYILEDGGKVFLSELDVESSGEVVEGTTIPMFEMLEETDKFEAIKKTLAEMDSVDWEAASAWYLCQSDAEGHLRFDAFGYLFVNEAGEGWVLIYENGSAYPTQIMPMTYDLWISKNERITRYEENKGIYFDHNVIALDLETGEVS